MGQNNTQANGHAHSGFPWSHVFGFILSLALTFLALYVALYSNLNLSLSTILTSIIAMAVAQAALQLVMFMHMKEGEGTTQTITMLFSFFIAAVTVGGTVWIFFSM
ncbi:cytochrome aa3 quinol oxidase subunit IV [Bacillus sp. DX1.1]|uniref:cytochrome aa3 quinol oxidase subunit IV n=1 Tax=unclassified Bacillus (in: firmicutes) TaxID=185979 RepID=UPI0025709B2B|nr:MULTISPECIES: cytochrome aa3 quinol oxidase subunit IV [unclassified Bacillus (in: firmicutes)]MDM5153479.1 cytochrome aa3 quinol oxidase subunit IV [Bacillus sp. DX1.1]WJE82434.1 cytochrome aa3 quinol oxidase subunit IV [Bacillus sp. DX3.1]